MAKFVGNRTVKSCQEQFYRNEQKRKRKQQQNSGRKEKRARLKKNQEQNNKQEEESWDLNDMVLMRCVYPDGEKEQQELNIYRVVDTRRIPCGSSEEIEVEMFIIPKGQKLYVPVTSCLVGEKRKKGVTEMVPAHLLHFLQKDIDYTIKSGNISDKKRIRIDMNKVEWEQRNNNVGACEACLNSSHRKHIQSCPRSKDYNGNKKE